MYFFWFFFFFFKQKTAYEMSIGDWSSDVCSSDLDGLEEFWTLAGHVREAAGELPVGFGFIELAEPLVDTGIDELVAHGSREVVSVPLVLLAAGHLKNDG